MLFKVTSISSQQTTGYPYFSEDHLNTVVNSVQTGSLPEGRCIAQTSDNNKNEHLLDV